MASGADQRETPAQAFMVFILPQCLPHPLRKKANPERCARCHSHDLNRLFSFSLGGVHTCITRVSIFTTNLPKGVSGAYLKSVTGAYLDMNL